jgi:hypothetical protein
LLQNRTSTEDSFNHILHRFTANRSHLFHPNPLQVRFCFQPTSSRLDRKKVILDQVDLKYQK